MHPNNSTVLKIIFSALATIFGTQLNCSAQVLFSVTSVYHVKPEMRSDFEAVQKEISLAYEKAGVPSRIVMSTIMGDLLEYRAVYPIQKFAELSAPDPVVRALGEEAAEKLLRRRDACVTSIQTLFTIFRADLSLYTQGEAPGTVVIASILHAAPGRQLDLESSIVNDLIPAYRKVGARHVWVSDVLFGGDAIDLSFMIFINDVEVLDAGPPFSRALGPVGAAKVQARLTGMAASDNVRILRVRPDLSLMPNPAATTHGGN